MAAKQVDLTAVYLLRVTELETNVVNVRDAP